MKIFAILLAASLALTPAPAQKRPMTFQDLMAMKRVSDPQISPSGKWVLFSVTDVSLEKNTKVNHLWVVPIAGGKEIQVTTGEGESNGRFSPDGKKVALSMKGQIYEMPWDESTGKLGEPTQVTNVNGGADGAIWSPDSKRLMFVVSVYPECSEKADWAAEDACDKAKDDAANASPVKAQLFTGLLYRHWNAFTGERRSHVAVVNAADGTGLRDLTPASAVGTAETPTFSLGGPLGYAWAPDSKEIAYVTNLDKVPAASTNNDVFTLRLDEGGAKSVKVSTSLGSDDGPSYSGDGKYLAFRSQARAGYESDRFRLMIVDRAAKTTREAFPNFKGWIDEFIWGDKWNHYFDFTSSFEGEERIYSGALGGEVQLVRKGGEFSQLVQAAATSSWGANFVAVKMKVGAPAEVFSVGTSDSALGTAVKPGGGVVADRFGVSISNNSSCYQLTHLNDFVLAELALGSLTSFWFEGAQGTKVQGFIVKPPNFDPKKKYPVKFLIHGGPQGAWGDAWSYRWNPELMAASGYVVVMVNPRGSTGYGQAFIDGVNGDWGGKAYIDLMKGLDAAEAQFPFIDKTRECALGASYGGFMANWVLTHTNRFKCIVTHDGMFNPAAAYGDTEEMWFNEWEFKRPGTTEPGQPWRYAALPADQDPFRKWSPMLHIQDAKTPTLVIHSQKDYRLDVSEGFQLFTALQRLNVPSEMLYFPDEGHWVQKPQNSQLWNKTVSDWCDKWTHTNAYAGK
jgi:dipeptidyl aminopeptidase/acylaminoacyl peptidase